MNLRELIELGAQKAGSKTALAAHLQIPRALLMDAQAGRSALPIIAADRLAEYTHTDPLQAVYAAEAQRAKDPKKKAYFEQRLMAKAAAIAAIAISLVILEMTPNNAQAAPPLGFDSRPIDVMLTTLILFMLYELQRQLTHIGPKRFKLPSPRPAHG